MTDSEQPEMFGTCPFGSVRFRPTRLLPSLLDDPQVIRTRWKAICDCKFRVSVRCVSILRRLCARLAQCLCCCVGLACMTHLYLEVKATPTARHVRVSGGYARALRAIGLLCSQLPLPAPSCPCPDRLILVCRAYLRGWRLSRQMWNQATQHHCRYVWAHMFALLMRMRLSRLGSTPLPFRDREMRSSFQAERDSAFFSYASRSPPWLCLAPALSFRALICA